MPDVSFRKGHGTGNDFIVLWDVPSADLDAETVRALCERRTGLGADGVLNTVRTVDAAEPTVREQSDRATWFMDHRNADGTLPEMCGNGARLFARHLVDAGLEQPGTFAIATRGGARAVTVPSDPHGEVEVAMGRAEFARARIQPYVSYRGGQFPTVAVFVPNPHAVTYVDDLAAVTPLDLAPTVDVSVVFPAGANIEFVQRVGERHIGMVVWERGVGPTLSCGTGAVAAMVVAAVRDDAPTEVDYRVDLPGGRLGVRRDTDGGLHLRGPAVFVADGRTSLLSL